MKHKAFTLIEMLVAVAIVLILMGAMITVTGHLKSEARKRLTQSALGVIATALEQYYENTSPKQYPPMVLSNGDFNEKLYGVPPTQTTSISPAVASNFWNSGSLYYFLNRVPQSKSILNGLVNQMISNRDLGGTAILIEIPAGTSGTDFVRFVDAWGTTIRYDYWGSGFPVITSAGPDKIFGTEDDVVGQ